jgi:hypothetical protein
VPKRFARVLEDLQRRGADVEGLKADHRAPARLLEATESLTGGWCGTPFQTGRR